MVGQLTPAYVCRQNVLKIKIYQLDLKCFELQAAGVAFFIKSRRIYSFYYSVYNEIQTKATSSEETFLRIC